MLAFKVAGILDAVEAIIRSAGQSDGRERSGGCLVVRAKTDPSVCPFAIGTVVDLEAQINYWKNGQEKTQRLFVHKSHISGWQSRNVAGKKYGGSIRALDGSVYGFSGFSEYWDESVSAAVARLIDPDTMPETHLQALASLSGNKDIVRFVMRW